MKPFVPNFRPEPLNCASCGGRMLRHHCESEKCCWRICKKCLTVNGTLLKFDELRDAVSGRVVSRSASGYVRSSFKYGVWNGEE